MLTNCSWWRLNKIKWIDSATGCTLWTRKANTTADNGVFYGFLSESDCTAVCLASPGCIAVDLGPHGCVIHNNISDLTTAYSSPGVTQFVLNRQCLPSTLPSVTVEATNFADVTGIDIMDTCTWLLFHWFLLKALVNIVYCLSSNEKHLAVIPRVCVCVRVCSGCETWSKQEGVASQNGVLYPFTSLTNCLQLCLEMPTCVAVDVSMDTCVIHTNANDMATRFNASGFTQYTLNRTCQSSSTISTPSAANNDIRQGTTQSTHLGN